MPNIKYVGEFEIHASTTLLYPYFTTPAGLQDWFADKVHLSGDRLFTFVWGGDQKCAKLVVEEPFELIRFQFIRNADEGDRGLPAFLEFQMAYNELTQSTFVKVLDYSDIADPGELDQLWKQFMEDLRFHVGAA